MRERALQRVEAKMRCGAHRGERVEEGLEDTRFAQAKRFHTLFQ
jgi:hypothetical protein